MMNARHLTGEEQQILRDMANHAGAVEMLRCIAQIICNDHPDITCGDRIRTKINNIANNLNSEKWGDSRDD